VTGAGIRLSVGSVHETEHFPDKHGCAGSKYSPVARAELRAIVVSDPKVAAVFVTQAEL